MEYSRKTKDNSKNKIIWETILSRKNKIKSKSSSSKTVERGRLKVNKSKRKENGFSKEKKYLRSG